MMKPHHATSYNKSLFLRPFNKTFPSTRGEAIMNKTTAPGHSNQTAIVTDRRILGGPIASDVERRNLCQGEFCYEVLRLRNGRRNYADRLPHVRFGIYYTHIRLISSSIDHHTV